MVHDHDASHVVKIANAVLEAKEEVLSDQPHVPCQVQSYGLPLVIRLSTDHTSSTLYSFLLSVVKIGSGETTALILH